MQIMVIGAGSIGMRHIKNLLMFDRELSVSVVEPDKDRRERVVGNYPVKVFDNLTDALDSVPVKAAFICTPNHRHIPQAIELARAGCHLFIEKPLSLDPFEVKELIPLVDEQKLISMVGCNLRFHPGVLAISHILHDKTIGRPLYARAQFAHSLPNWRPTTDYRLTYSSRKEEGGGILLDDIHEPDYLVWLFGHVTGVKGCLSNISDLKINVEDTADYLLFHENNFYSHIHADYLRQDKIRSCDVIGTNGTVEWLSIGKNPEEVRVRYYDAGNDVWKILYENQSYNPNQQYIDEISYFLDCIDKNTATINPISSAIHLMEVLCAVRANSEQSVSAMPGVNNSVNKIQAS